MKIGIDCRIFSSKFTGIGRYTHELVDYIIATNAEALQPHEIVLFFNNPEFNEFQETPNVKKVLVNAKHYSLAEQTRFLRILNKERCDLVHFPHFNIPILYRKPYTVTIHDLILHSFPGQKMTKWYHRLAYKLTVKNAIKTAKQVLTVSENTKKDINKYFSIDSNKVQVIYNGISDSFQLLPDTKPAAKTLKKYKIRHPFLLYTGVWRNHKNLPRLIKVLKILREEKNLDLQLVITGKPDPHYPEVQNAVEKFQLQDQVVFPGLVPEKELIHLYNAAFIFVYPSLYEGFGLPPLESMRCGTPVVASNSSSIPEVCGQENALFFNPHDTQQIADQIEKLFKDANLQVELIAKGSQHAAKFTWQKTGENTWGAILKAAKSA